MYKIVTFKAFGDFLIACNAVRALKVPRPSQSISIIAGTHVRPLANALNIPDHHVEYFSDGVSSDVPAIFDLRKQGVFSALKSLRCISRQMSHLDPDVELVFDRFGWRQRLIGLGRKVHCLPRAAENIYVGYDLFFESIGYVLKSEELPSAIGISRAVIVPGARMNLRIIPASTILNIYRELERRGIEVRVILLDGEKIDVPLGLAVEVVPRSFSSLVTSIRDSNFIVSADSLPAHLGAYLGIPAFVFTPIPDWTSYWLPKSAFLTKGMATFVDLGPFRKWLDKFFSTGS